MARICTVYFLLIRDSNESLWCDVIEVRATPNKSLLSHICRASVPTAVRFPIATDHCICEVEFFELRTSLMDNVDATGSRNRQSPTGGDLRTLDNRSNLARPHFSDIPTRPAIAKSDKSVCVTVIVTQYHIIWNTPTPLVGDQGF